MGMDELQIGAGNMELFPEMEKKQPNFNHVMLDLETLSTAKDAAILSIGAVKFCLETYTLGEEFYRVVLLDSCIDANLSIDASTIDWWMGQSDEARAIFNLPNVEEFIDERVFDTAKVRMPLFLVLHHFRKFVKPPGHIQADPCIWGNGATFDNVILRNAYEECGAAYPVSYKNDLCYRTVKRLFDLTNKVRVTPGVKHNALDDARAQAVHLMYMLKAVHPL